MDWISDCLSGFSTTGKCGLQGTKYRKTEQDRLQTNHLNQKPDSHFPSFLRLSHHEPAESLAIDFQIYLFLEPNPGGLAGFSLLGESRMIQVHISIKLCVKVLLRRKPQQNATKPKHIGTNTDEATRRQIRIRQIGDKIQQVRCNIVTIPGPRRIDDYFVTISSSTFSRSQIYLVLLCLIGSKVYLIESQQISTFWKSGCGDDMC
jgi:hypothetical protein